MRLVFGAAKLLNEPSIPSENTKENTDRDKSGRQGDGEVVVVVVVVVVVAVVIVAVVTAMATIIVMEIMLLLMMIRLIWLIPGMMRALFHNKGGLFWQGRASEACNRVVGSKRNDVTF